MLKQVKNSEKWTKKRQEIDMTKVEKRTTNKNGPQKSNKEKSKKGIKKLVNRQNKNDKKGDK